MPVLKPETELYVILVGNLYVSVQNLLKDLRQEGLRCTVDTSGRKIDKQIKTAEKKGIDYVLFVGPEELESQLFKLKNIKTGVEQTLSPARVVTTIKDIRKSSNI